MFKNHFTQVQKESIKKFNQMINKGDLSFEEVSCLCGHAGFVKISSHDRFGFQQRVVVCRKCGLMMSSPRLTNKSYQVFYSTDIYRMIYQDEDYLETAERKLNSDYGKYLFEDLYPLIKEHKNLNVLEFGCGGGWNLIHFLRAGYKVTGYDYSPTLTQLGKTYRLDLREGTIGDVEGEYDIIILNHVIEHFTDLFGSMKAIVNHLKPGGLMYIGVPNMDNYGSLQLQNAHVYYFTPRTFKYFMGLCGLRIIQFGSAQKIHMYGVFELGSQDSSIFTLESEPKRIFKTIKRAQIRECAGRVLDKIGVKELIKSALRRFSSEK